jgi:hypothetical protein
MYVLLIVVCPFVLFLLAIVLSVLLRNTDSDCPFGIFKLFLRNYLNSWWYELSEVCIHSKCVVLCKTSKFIFIFSTLSIAMGTVRLRYFCPIPFKFLGHFVKLESMIICIYKLETVKSCPLAGRLISIGISMLVVKLRMR